MSEEMKQPAPLNDVVGSAADVAAKLQLWFFRDMFESNRLALFSLFGFKAADMDTMGKQQVVFRRILSALSRQPVTKPAPVQRSGGSDDLQDHFSQSTINQMGQTQVPVLMTPTPAPRDNPDVTKPAMGEVTLSAETVLAIRDALIGDSVEEAYHQLYKAVDPDFIKLQPWAEIERAALAAKGEEL